jgi:endonuclease G
MKTSVLRWSPGLLALCLACTPPPITAREHNRNIRFGMPAPARTDPENRTNYLITRPQYVLSYNAETRGPNWVSWRLTRDDIGHAERGPFEPDPLLPRHFPHVTSSVYNESGFDRGHMCPAKDRSAHQEDCDATFFMSNVIPQSPAGNQKGWERLESYCRELAEHGHELHIVCGPHGVGGAGKNGHAEEIGKSRLKVTVPNKVWKVILVLPHAGAEPRRNTRVIAVIMPNNQSVGFDWPKYRVSVREVEKLTGYSFFRRVPEEVAVALKEGVDDVEVHVSIPHHAGGSREREKKNEGGSRPRGGDR